MSRESQFHESYARHVDPLDGQHADFDWDGLARALNEEEELPETEMERLSFALRHLLAWIITGNRKGGLTDAALIGRRAIALAWVIDPGLHPGSPSLATLGSEVGVTRASLSLWAAEASRLFGVRNRAQEVASRTLQQRAENAHRLRVEVAESDPRCCPDYPDCGCDAGDPPEDETST